MMAMKPYRDVCLANICSTFLLSEGIRYEDDDDHDRAIRCNSSFFYNLLTAPRTVSNTLAEVARRSRVQITCKTSGAHHVQQVVCRVVRSDGTAIKLDRVEIAFILAFCLFCFGVFCLFLDFFFFFFFFLWSFLFLAEPLTDEDQEVSICAQFTEGKQSLFYDSLTRL